MQEGDSDYKFKVILLGDVGVGKSKILIRFLQNEFNESSQTTIGVEFATKTVTTATGRKINLQIWDTAGQQRYNSLMSMYYKGSSAALIVYDIAREASFAKLQNYHTLIKEHVELNIVTMVVGNKADLDHDREVTQEQGLSYAESRRVAFYQVSAKTGLNVELIFTRIAEELARLMGADSGPPDPHPNPPSRPKNTNIQSPNANQNKKKKCCS